MISMAVLGVGRMGAVHARNVAANGEAELRVVADPDTATARAVIVATPTDTHADLVERLAAAGKAVFCEKPIDLDVARVRACLGAVERAGTALFVGFNRRFHASFAVMRARLRAGEIGRLEVLSIASLDPVPPPLDYVRRSGDLFRDMMIHDLDLARWLIDEPIVEVRAVGSSLVDPAIGAAGDWDTAIATLKSERGTLCHITNSRRAVHGHGPRLEALGAEGVLRADNWTPTPERVLDPRFQARFAEAYRAELAAFIASLRDGATLEPTGRDGLAALLPAEAATLSARTGDAVTPEKV